MKAESPHSALYVASRREYNEQVGTLASQRDSWRLAALGAIAVSFVAVSGGIWDHTNNHSVPYVVRVDRLGDALAVSRANIASPLDPSIMRAQLAHWIFDARSVFIDVTAQRKLISDLYAMLDKHGAATPFMNDWFAQNSPFTRASEMTVSVDVNSVLPLSASTWQVQWRETPRARNGQLLPYEDWRAIVTVSVNPPNNDAAILVNPTGLFVESITWQKI